jgi:REP element-mobilizing transposase RayT
MSKYIHKSHNASVLLYHVVCPAKYRKIIFVEKADIGLKEICIEISKRYEIQFVEIGTDKDHVHFLLQGTPLYSPSRIVQTIKSITAREMFKRMPEIKKELWGGEFWSKGYYISTVGVHGNENMIQQYVKEQGREKEYNIIHKEQLTLF